MAKKILSILCALAMMVTMVSVAAFSVSADEPTTGTFDLSAGTYPAGTTFSNGTYCKGFTFMNHTGVKTGTFAEPYTIGDSFELSFWYTTYSSHADSNYAMVTIGDYSFKINVVAEGGYDAPLLTILKNGESVATAAGTGAKRTKYRDAKAESFSSLESDVSGTYLYDVHNYYNSGRYTTVMSYSFHNRYVSISYNDGVFTFTTHAPSNSADPLTATYTDTAADLSSATMSVDLSVHWQKAHPHAIHNFTGTYALPVSEPEVPDEPVVEDSEIIFDADNFSFVKNSGTSIGYGVPASAAGEGLEKFAFIITKASATATSLDTYDIGDKFDISFQLVMYNSVNHTYTFSVGDLDIVLALSGTDPMSTVTATYGDQTVIAADTVGNSVGRQLVSGANKDNNTYISDGNTLDGNYLTGTSYNIIFTNVTISYDSGTLSVNLAKPDGAGKTMTGTISNADFTDSAVSIDFVQNADGYPMHAIHNFTGTYTPYVAPEVDPLAPGKFLSINDSLALNFAYVQGALADYTDVEVNASIGERGETLTPVTKTIEGTTYDVYVVDFLTPDLFGTDVEFSITAKKGGEDVSYETTYSVKDYCVNMMNSGSAALKDLCSYILVYGEAARILEGGSNSVTDGVDLSDINESLAWSPAGLTGNYGLSGTEGPATWNSGNLNLADNIGINFTFTLPEGATLDDFNVVVDVDGSDFGLVGGDVESITALGNNKYKVVARVFAYDMTKDVTAKIVVNDGSNAEASYVFTSGVQNYVLEAIAKDAFDANELDVAYAMLSYGNAAAAYKASL